MTRVEHDLLGDREVPDDGYYGIYSVRAIENVPVTAIPLSSHPDLVDALACVTHAAALANSELSLSGPEASAMVYSAWRIWPERHYPHHPHRQGAGDDPEVT